MNSCTVLHWQKNPWFSSQISLLLICRVADKLNLTLVGLQADAKAYINVAEQARLGFHFLEAEFANLNFRRIH